MKATVIVDGIQVKVTTAWRSSAVREMCIKHRWYTRGCTANYDKMLDFVRYNDPTPENIYRVAKMIFDHSVFDVDLFTIESIMFTIQDETVKRFYSVKLEGGK